MNLENINKWLDNEFGVSYTRLEELHDFVVEQDLKHQEEKDKEIERLNKECDAYMKIATKRGNIINELEKWIKDYIPLLEAGDIVEETTQDTLKEVLDKLKELKENKDIELDILKALNTDLDDDVEMG